MPTPLTDRQSAILNYIAAFVHDNGYSPTIREIMAGAAISSTSVVAYNLWKLEESGYVQWKRGQSRSISLRTQVDGGSAVAIAEVYEGEDAELVRSALGRLAEKRRILELCRMVEKSA